MAKNNDSIMTMSGEVVEALPNATFRVKIETGQIILTYLSGKMRLHSINIMVGDLVQLEMSIYDLTKGRITYRTGRQQVGA